jgi:hypothetical protein
MTFDHTLCAKSHWHPAAISSNVELTMRDEVESTLESWDQWQRSVIQLLRSDFTEALHHIGFDEVDWASWRTFYNEGRSPKAAIDRALERDF